MLEFHNRVCDKTFGYQIAKVIDEMNEELQPTIKNINTMCFVKNQPEIKEEVLMRLIGIYNSNIIDLYNEYKYVTCN